MINLDKLRLGQIRGPRAMVPNSKAPPRKRYNKFIRGPLPLDWFMVAARQQGKAMNIALALWYLAGLNKSNTVKLTHRILKDFGVSPRTSYRLLKHLETSGLVEITRHRGRSPIITIKVEESSELSGT